jgi:hypothetical protein
VPVWEHARFGNTSCFAVMPLFPTGHKAMEKYEYDYLIHFLGLSTMSQLRTPACTKKKMKTYAVKINVVTTCSLFNYKFTTTRMTKWLLVLWTTNSMKMIQVTGEHSNSPHMGWGLPPLSHAACLGRPLLYLGGLLLATSTTIIQPLMICKFGCQNVGQPYRLDS